MAFLFRTGEVHMKQQHFGKMAYRFPDPDLTGPEGLVAVGGDLSPECLLTAYRQGIFPWFDEKPYLWWSPDPRCAIVAGELHIPARLWRVLRSSRFSIRYDTAFAEVCRGCALTPRHGETGTWITPEMYTAYTRLHELGIAHSAEAWRDGRLVGGLYGLLLGRVFFGESMFHLEPEASKAAFATFALHFFDMGGGMIDCQQTTAHMLRFGARALPRRVFLDMLRACLAEEMDLFTS